MRKTANKKRNLLPLAKIEEWAYGHTKKCPVCFRKAEVLKDEIAQKVKFLHDEERYCIATKAKHEQE